MEQFKYNDKNFCLKFYLAFFKRQYILKNKKRFT